MLLSEDLSFSPHIGKVSQKASSNLGFICRNLKGCPERLKELAYITLVRPSLEYASSVWDPHTRLDIASGTILPADARWVDYACYIRRWIVRWPCLLTSYRRLTTEFAILPTNTNICQLKNQPSPTHFTIEQWGTGTFWKWKWSQHLHLRHSKPDCCNLHISCAALANPLVAR